MPGGGKQPLFSLLDPCPSQQALPLIRQLSAKQRQTGRSSAQNTPVPLHPAPRKDKAATAATRSYTIWIPATPNSLSWGHAQPPCSSSWNTPETRASVCLLFCANIFPQIFPGVPLSVPEALCSNVSSSACSHPRLCKRNCPPSPLPACLFSPALSQTPTQNSFHYLFSSCLLSLICKRPAMRDLLTHYPWHRVNAY